MSNVPRQEFFTLAKLRSFQNYRECFQDSLHYITHELQGSLIYTTYELSQPESDHHSYKIICKIIRDQVYDFMEEIGFLTGDCVLPVSECIQYEMIS